MKIKNIFEVENQGRLWVNVTHQGEKELHEIQKRFGFDESDVKESLPPFQRPKIVKREHYYFMVLHFPVFDRETFRLGFTEVDFFLSQNVLVTVHDNKLPAIEAMFNECKKNQSNLTEYFSGTAVHVLFELLSRLFDGTFPILLHVNDDINLVDRKLFTKTSGRHITEEILRLKTNIVTFRRTMQGHRTVLERLLSYAGRELDLGSYQSYINSLREFTNEIWHILESQKESINALHETNESLLTLRTNNVMRVLTIISVTTFPLTLLATIFAIPTLGNPITNLIGGFWVVLILMLFGAVGMFTIFKKKDWV
ncbi:MAG: magnesium transporter CorA family protein [Candidatus Magasanikbacteria bacterium]|jgi:magnesium transporter